MHEEARGLAVEPLSDVLAEALQGMVNCTGFR